MRDVFGLALAAVGRDPPRLGVPWTLAYSAAIAIDAAMRIAHREPKLLVLDEVRLARLPLFFSSDRARAELGYAPGPAADALAAAARWFADRDNHVAWERTNVRR
jgi:dihydroflavonol-4-reductase